MSNRWNQRVNFDASQKNLPKVKSLAVPLRRDERVITASDPTEATMTNSGLSGLVDERNSHTHQIRITCPAFRLVDSSNEIKQRTWINDVGKQIPFVLPRQPPAPEIYKILRALSETE